MRRAMTVGAVALLLAAGACVDPETGRMTPEGAARLEGAKATLHCLPKGVYLAEVLRPEFEYTPEQEALIDATRLAECDPIPAGYVDPAPVEEESAGTIGE